MLQAGIKGKKEITVTLDKTAKAMGSGTMDVFATPAMIALMENTAFESVASELEEGSGTVGTALDIKHVSATPVGMKVTCESELVKVDGIAPRQTKFETDKAKLRRTIREALAAASGFDEFAALLLRHGVTVKESRGRLSYLTPDRTKPITARKLGDDFDRAAVLSVLEQNAARAAEKPAAIAEYPGSIKDRLRTKKEAKNAPNNDAVQRMVDIAAKRAEGKGRGYEKWATMHNLKQMSATLMLYQQYGFSSPDELDAAISAANTATQESLAGLKGLEAAIREKKELQRNLLGYIGTKPARDGLKAQKSEKARRAYREQHESDFIIADTAARYFREHGITKLPASKALQREIEQLTVQKNAGYNDYREKRQRAQELQTVRRNIDQILRGAPSQQKKREQER